MSLCGGWSAVRIRTKLIEGMTLFCRSWQCPDCAPRRLSSLKHMAMDGNPTTFLTLTINPAQGQSVAERAQELSDALKKLIKSARRKFTKGPIEYLAVFEETKRGEPHLHLLMRAPYLPQPWLSRTMDELIKSPIVDIRKVGSKRGAAKYIAKYVAKGPSAFGKLKRYWATPKFVEDKPSRTREAKELTGGWRCIQQALFLVVEDMIKLGHEIEWSGDHRFTCEARRRGPYYA